MAKNGDPSSDPANPNAKVSIVIARGDCRDAIGRTTCNGCIGKPKCDEQVGRVIEATSGSAQEKAMDGLLQNQRDVAESPWHDVSDALKGLSDAERASVDVAVEELTVEYPDMDEDQIRKVLIAGLLQQLSQ
jgi:hypothetical protein